MKKQMKTLYATLFLAALAGCSRDEPKPAAPPAPQAAPPATAAAPAPAKVRQSPYADLMCAVFGTGYRPATADALADMPDADNPNATVRMVASAAGSTRLPTGETVLAVSADVAEDDGTAMAGHSSPGILSIYLLDNANGQWRVLRRHESVAALGSFGQIGEVKWVELAKGKTGLAVLNGATYQGATVTYLALFDPTAAKVADLMAEDPAVYSGNGDDCGPMPTCWEAKADWRFEPGSAVYDDLVLTITGHEDVAKDHDAETGGDDKPVARVRKPIHGKARYVFDGKQYRLSEGENTIPGI
jgi:predicted small lipoprotein YifL